MRALVIDDAFTTIPNPGGQEAFASDWVNGIASAEGGWYSGKSYIGSRKLITLHLYNAFDGKGEATYVPHFVVAPTYANAMDFCVPHLQDACNEANLSYRWHGTGYLPGGRYAGPAIILPDLGTRSNPSVILIRTADVPKRITGFTAGGAWGDEPARWKIDRHNPVNDAFIQMTGRVRHTKARFLQIIMTYTNEGDMTRVYEEMHSGKPDRQLYRIPTRENPVAAGFYQRQLTNLTPELAEQYLEGKAAALRGGKVYTQFDMNENVDSNLTLRRGLPIQISLDFNIMPGMHCILGQYHGDLDLFTAIYEIHAPRMSVRELVAQLGRLLIEIQWDKELRGHTLPPLEVFGDATGRSEWAGTGFSSYHVLQQGLKDIALPYRLRVPKSNPPIIDRINAVNVALRDLSGAVHYKMHPRCKRLIEDMVRQEWNPQGEMDTRDRKLSHASSAEGYRIWFIRPIRVGGEDIGGKISV